MGIANRKLTVLNENRYIVGVDSASSLCCNTRSVLHNDPVKPGYADVSDSRRALHRFNRRSGYLDGATREIDILDRSPEGDYVLQHSLKVPQLDLLRLEVEDMNHDDRDDLVVIGRQKVIVFYGRRAEVGLQEVLSYSVEKEKDFGSPQDLTVGDFNADGWLDVVMTTAPRYNLLALSLPGESVKHASDHRDYKKPADALSGRLKMELAFPVFEEKSYMRRGSGHGPRQMTVADVDGDGLDDLVLLIHDRILVYLQDLCSEE